MREYFVLRTVIWVSSSCKWGDENGQLDKGLYQGNYHESKEMASYEILSHKCNDCLVSCSEKCMPWRVSVRLKENRNSLSYSSQQHDTLCQQADTKRAKLWPRPTASNGVAEKWVGKSERRQTEKSRGGRMVRESARKYTFFFTHL